MLVMVVQDAVRDKSLILRSAVETETPSPGCSEQDDDDQVVAITQLQLVDGQGLSNS